MVEIVAIIIYISCIIHLANNPWFNVFNRIKNGVW